MLRGLLTLATFAVSTTILGVIAIAAGLATGKREIVFRLGRFWSRLHLSAMGIHPQYEGLDHASGTAPRVFLANHFSTLDIWVLVPALPDTTRFVAKKSIFWIPVLGQAMRVAGFIPIDRADRTRAIRSLGRAGARIASGESVILFPEGTRSRDGKLGRFKRGSFHLALETGVPIVPVAISGTGRVVAPRSIVVRPGPVRVTFLPPIDTSAYTTDTLDELLERTRDAISRHLDADERGTDEAPMSAPVRRARAW
ncbi:MAG TPA: lysophospholipid acyltransferase family protein [Candidatus Polarisedimenticolaceae bacterium]|nr:lysophospholipid acyltransferase family protein [Candidatus Polarisedimenticolaceae bacterium]